MRRTAASSTPRSTRRSSPGSSVWRGGSPTPPMRRRGGGSRGGAGAPGSAGGGGGGAPTPRAGGRGGVRKQTPGPAGTRTAGGFPFEPRVEPMLAKLGGELPAGDGWLFEPKWDGFRALVFRDGDRIYTQSRDLRPLDRYFPELAPMFRSAFPKRCVVDGEIVIASPCGLDFDAL